MNGKDSINLGGKGSFKMTKQKVGVSRLGSWTWCIFWLLVFFPIGVLYWLLKMKKTKTYEYK